MSSDQLDQVQRTATVSRLLSMALAALAMGLGRQALSPELGTLGGGYLLLVAALRLLGSRLPWTWLASLFALVDVLVVTAFLVLSATAAWLWPLYFFPLAGAAPAGRVPAASAGVLSIASYLAALQLTAGSASEAVLPAALLVAATLMTSVLVTSWQDERQERRVLREVVAAARALLAEEGAEATAARVAERARRLARAERGWLWWRDEAGQLHPAAHAGPPPEPAWALERLAADQERQLERGPLPLAELGEPFSDVAGEALLLRRAERILAVLAVAWEAPPRDRAALRQRLRLFAPWATHALAEARARANAQQELWRESALRRAAESLAATLDPREVYEALAAAAASGLGATACLAERASGRILAGQAEVAESLLRTAIEAGAPPSGAGRPLGHHPDGLRVTLVGPELALLAWRAEPPLDEADGAWLDELAALAREALGRCAAHAHLRADEQRLRASLEALPAPAAVWDARGNLVLASAAYRELNPPTGPPPVAPAGGVREAELVLGDPPRTFVVMAATAAEGRYVAAVYREITREREALRLKDELISLAGHELRTPLTSIHGYSQMMARQLRTVEQQVEQLNRIVGDLLHASRPEGSPLALHLQLLDAAELARAAAERFRARHPGRQLRLRLAPVPRVEGDPARLGQVLDNLLDNAAKYSPAEREVLLSVEQVEREVVLSVRDQGIGIAPEHQPHLFSRFYRAPGAAESARGLGLGLSIVKDLVAAHGGRVWAESAGLGHGSTFRVALPVAHRNGRRPEEAAASAS